jgi:hypothetical protein
MRKKLRLSSIITFPLNCKRPYDSITHIQRRFPHGSDERWFVESGTGSMGPATLHQIHPRNAPAVCSSHLIAFVLEPPCEPFCFLTSQRIGDHRSPRSPLSRSVARLGFTDGGERKSPAAAGFGQTRRHMDSGS